MRVATGSSKRTQAGLRLIAASLVVGLASVAVAVVPAQVASAATDVVTTCASTGTGSLPVVVGAAGSGDTITFQSGLTCPPTSPITLTSTLTISQSLTITGPGASKMAVSGGNAVEVFGVNSGTMTISGLTIEYAHSAGGNGGGIYNNGTLTLAGMVLSGNVASFGGGIYNDSGGVLIVSNSTLSGNSAEAGGGIFSDGTTYVSNSTLTGNSAADAGGIWSDGTTNVSNSTLTDNHASKGGGAILVSGGSVTVNNSTLSDNGAEGIDNSSGGTVNLGATIVANSTSGGDCYGGIIDLGYNLDSDGSCGFSTANHDLPSTAPKLGPLQNNGGPTETMIPALGSPVIGVIPSSPATILNGVQVCPRTDQRGVESIGKCTIGAAEGGFLITTTSLPNATPGTVYGPVTLTSQEAGMSTSPYFTTLKWKKVSLPKGLKLSKKTGVLSGTPSKKLTGGASSVKVQVTETVTTRNGKKKIKTKTTVQATIPLTIT